MISVSLSHCNYTRSKTRMHARKAGGGGGGGGGGGEKKYIYITDVA